MTIEGRPFIGPDTTYDQQRRCRMADSINDYLNDTDVTARRTYEEMIAEIDDVIKYHQDNLNKAKEVPRFTKPILAKIFPEEEELHEKMLKRIPNSFWKA